MRVLYTEGPGHRWKPLTYGGTFEQMLSKLESTRSVRSEGPGQGEYRAEVGAAKDEKTVFAVMFEDGRVWEADRGWRPNAGHDFEQSWSAVEARQREGAALKD